MVLYTLFEHAAGYAVFKINATEEIGALLPEVQESVVDLERFGRLVKLVAFSPFKNAANALENMNNISEGVVHEDLKVFLSSNVPTGKKKTKVQLGISDTKIGAAIQESCDIQCESGAAVLEITRGIRFHFHKLIQGLTATTSGKAQLGLGHSYSRAKVKFNVHRVDNMIIQTIALLDQLDKDINTFSMRIREWYSYHFPELIKIVNDNQMYAKVAQFIKCRKDFNESKLEGLEEIVMDEGKAKAIFEASKSSMGMDISPIDLINIESFASRVIGLIEYRLKLHEYLQSKMFQVAPNLQALIGDLVGARLIAHAGSLTNLAKYPASTVQILGAEKALFRALKTKGKTPKYGLIFHSSFIGRAGAKNKGRISRYLANKCSIASRIDCFSDTPTNLFGKKLHEQVNDRLKFYETGEAPMKNADAMQEVLEEFAAVVRSERKSDKKKKKMKEQEEVNGEAAEVEEIETSTREKSKKKKKRKLEEDVEQNDLAEEKAGLNGNEETENVEEKPKKKKKRRSEGADEIVDEEVVGLDASQKKAKKKKSRKSEDLDISSEIVEVESSETVEVDSDDKPLNIDDDSEPVSKKRKKSGRKTEETEDDGKTEETVDVIEVSEIVGEQSKKKKKKKSKTTSSGDDTIVDITTNGNGMHEDEVITPEDEATLSGGEFDTTMDELLSKKKKKKKKHSHVEE